MRIPKRTLLLVVSSLAVLALVGGAFVYRTVGTHAATTAGTTRTISLAGTSSFAAAAVNTDVSVANPEFPASASGSDSANGHGAGVNRSFSSGHAGHGSQGTNPGEAKSNPGLVTSFDGLNHFQQRFANGGNQFSVEPPDQGLCAGNGFVMESLNDVTQVYNTSGTPLLNGGKAVDLNTFYGYPAAINRSTGARGQFVTDPSCLYDQATGHWFNSVLTIEVNPSNGAFLGPNHVDIAVSQTSDPTGKWNIYRLPVQDDGTQGTPNHGCSFGPCFGDYPHIGADANGFYLTTNEYSFFGPEFHGAQVYAFSKRALASGASSVQVTQFDTHSAGVGGTPGFTVWPATAPGSQNDTANGGTEYFLSSTAADEVQVPDFSHPGTHQSNYILLWTLSNTSSLDSSSPSLSLSNSSIGVNTYAVPPQSNQKAGDVPLITCFNTPACATALIGGPDPYTEVEGNLDSNDSRMQQVTYANGKVWGALDTEVDVNGNAQAGIAYYIINPHAGNLDVQGTVGVADTNLDYPAIGVTPSGRGVVAFTLVGTNDYPSAAYASIDDQIGMGAIHLAAAGAGPQDGFTETKVESPFGNGVPRPRWGDYGSTAVVGNTIWFASEYIGQTCTYATYVSTAFRCGNTRSALGNWDTRISEVSMS